MNPHFAENDNHNQPPLGASPATPTTSRRLSNEENRLVLPRRARGKDLGRVRNSLLRRAIVKTARSDTLASSVLSTPKPPPREIKSETTPSSSIRRSSRLLKRRQSNVQEETKSPRPHIISSNDSSLQPTRTPKSTGIKNINIEPNDVTSSSSSRRRATDLDRRFMFGAARQNARRVLQQWSTVVPLDTPVTIYLDQRRPSQPSLVPSPTLVASTSTSIGNHAQHPTSNQWFRTYVRQYIPAMQQWGIQRHQILEHVHQLVHELLETRQYNVTFVLHSIGNNDGNDGNTHNDGNHHRKVVSPPVVVQYITQKLCQHLLHKQLRQLHDDKAEF